MHLLFNMNHAIVRLVHAFLAAMLVLPCESHAGDALSTFSRLNRAGLVVVDAGGRPLVADKADMPLMPASTTKLATAFLALSQWGERHRFRTEFYFDETNRTLWVKGSGDPYLVSEELDLIARNLKQRGLHDIKTIGLDTSLLQTDLILPGTGTSDNPYDAVPTAVSANFNTIAAKKVGGHIVSAEPITPLTPYAERLASMSRSGEVRINTGPNPQDAERYFGELFTAFLQKHGVANGTQIISGRAPAGQAFYTHENSKTLAEIVRAMLKYSTNFVANQLILMLSAEAYRHPVSSTDVRRYMVEKLSARFGWDNFNLEDGAGLSRNNRLSPLQLTELLQALKQWRHLLPEVEPGVYAKTGTLTGVSALAGFLSRHGDWKPFAVIMNESVPHHLRNRIAEELAERW